jgi:hypothetical protein
MVPPAVDFGVGFADGLAQGYTPGTPNLQPGSTARNIGSVLGYAAGYGLSLVFPPEEEEEEEE